MIIEACDNNMIIWNFHTQSNKRKASSKWSNFIELFLIDIYVTLNKYPLVENGMLSFTQY